MNEKPTMLLLRATWKVLNKLDAGPLFEEFLPGGSGFELLARLGVIDNLSSKGQIDCTVGGSTPRSVRPDISALTRALERTVGKDDIQYDSGGTAVQMVGRPLDEHERLEYAQLRMFYSASSRAVEPQHRLAVLSLRVRELGGLGRPGRELADFILQSTSRVNVAERR